MSDSQTSTSKIRTDAHVQMAQAQGGGAPLGSINRGLEEKVVMEKALKMGMSYIDIQQLPLNPDHLKLLSSEEAHRALVIPFFRVGKKLRLALVHPTNIETQMVIRKLKEAGYAINVNLASETGLRAALEAYKNLEPLHPIEEENRVDEEKLESYQKEIENLSALKQKIQTVTAEEALNTIHIGALKTGASDIHYQPEENQVLLRFRIDGILQEILRLDRGTYNYIANQLKYKAGMKLNVDNVPQDGRYFFRVNARNIDVRVASIPTEFGESFVCRLLDSRQKAHSFTELGFEGRNLQLLEKALKIPNGMILVTGPTGSGKTTTLYSLLNRFNLPENKIITLEDPIEYHLEGITQSQINEKRGYTFASGLRAILRQDPDIVMIGEIRDEDTSETSAQAALTGHVLLSTLHTNSAVETIPRLLNMGLQPFMIAPALGIVIAQRLVRKLCPYCVQQKPITEEERFALSRSIESIHSVYPDYNVDLPATLPHAPGCEQCSHTGYKGQLAIAEIFENTDDLKSQILSGVPSSDIFKLVRGQGMLTMSEDGALKVLRGMTTLEEIHRVTE